MYIVTEEDGPLTVCAIALGSAEIYPTVNIDLGKNNERCWTAKIESLILTANSNEDFVLLSSDIAFTAGLAPQCVTITIIDDQVPEPVETFQLQLTSSSIPRALITQPDTTITIIDSDRKLINCTGYTMFE